MTQDEMNCLLIRIIDEFQWIVWYQDFLRIAIEQVENPNSETLDRVELLLSTYLSTVEPHFEQIEWYIKRRDESSVEVLTDN
jgi:hypothetical protein